MKTSITEIRSIFMRDMNYTVVECITPNPEQDKNCFQLEDSSGAKMIDNDGNLLMVATAFSVEELEEIYNTEVYNNKLKFYKHS